MEQIEYNTYLTEKLGAGGSDKTQKEKAADMIRQVRASLEKLAADIQTVDSSYTSGKARDYLSFSEDGVRFTDKIGLGQSVLLAALILGAAFVCVFLGKYLSGRKEKAV